MLSSGRAAIYFIPGQPASACHATVILASGDLGWAGLVTDLADRLAAQGCDIVGLDTRAYLTAATQRRGALDPATVPGDFIMLLGASERWRPRQPTFLVGMSEGAGLSIVAAADEGVGRRVSGVVGLGTPATVTLGWRFWDWTTWVTHRTVDEPSVAIVPYLSAVSVPVAFVHSTGDEFVPLNTVRELYTHTGSLRRLDVVAAHDHQFSDARAAVTAKVVECLNWARHVFAAAVASSGLDQK
jgi:alpha-beta hydrolase superfamily lysophospholipase